MALDPARPLPPATDPSSSIPPRPDPAIVAAEESLAADAHIAQLAGVDLGGMAHVVTHPLRTPGTSSRLDAGLSRVGPPT
jgi:hypothetical protein